MIQSLKLMKNIFPGEHGYPVLQRKFLHGIVMWEGMLANTKKFDLPIAFLCILVYIESGFGG